MLFRSDEATIPNPQATGLTQDLTERDTQINDLNTALTQQALQLNRLQDNIIKKDSQIKQLDYQLNEKNKHIQAILNSKSWKLTAPIRTLTRLAKKQILRLRKPILRLAKRVYWKLPLRLRTPLVNFIYKAFPWVFSGTPHFDRWNNSHPIATAINQGGNLISIENVPLAEQAQGRIAIHLHMYYADLADEFVGYLNNMPFKYDLYISVTNQQSQAVCQEKFSNLPLLQQLQIEIVANRGRDIAPMFCAFGEQLQQYDYIAHLHSKKSLYNKGATEGWRQYLGSSLLGSPEQIRRIFTLLQGEQARGLVYPQNFHLIPYFANHWLANKAMGAQWCARLGIGHFPNVYFDFPAGTMFWEIGRAHV